MAKLKQAVFKVKPNAKNDENIKLGGCMSCMVFFQLSHVTKISSISLSS
jgi:hypothetical protein